MKAYITFTKKRLLAALMAFVCVSLVCYELYTAGNKITNAATNADRIIFIKQSGYKVIDQGPTVKTVMIPDKFYDVYTKYNALQQKAGYDLSAYKGCEVTLYTYKIETPPDYEGDTVINIIVYNDRVIGGDVSSVAFDGFMLPI